MRPTDSIALGGMEFYWDVFLASFFVSLFIIVFTFFFFRTVVLFVQAAHIRRTQEYQAKLNVAHLLGVAVTLKQIHQRKNEVIRSCDVCCICLVRLFTSYASFSTRICYVIDVCTDAMYTPVSGSTKRRPRIAGSALFSLLPPRMRREMVSIGTLFNGRERRVPAVQICYFNRRAAVRVCSSLSRSKWISQKFHSSQADHGGHWCVAVDVSISVSPCLSALNRACLPSTRDRSKSHDIPGALEFDRAGRM